MTTDELRDSMYRAMRELLGRGYVPDYYERAAVDFIAIADQAVSDEREACAKIADGCANTPPQIGPLFNAGISAASTHIAKIIRARDNVTAEGTA